MPTPRIGAAGLALGLQNLLINAQTLQAGQCWTIPAGTFLVVPGPVTSVQIFDSVAQQWRTINADNSGGPLLLQSDGTNYRLANLTGCPIGALITNSGSGYTNGVGSAATGLTVTPSAGGSAWTPVVGGAINSTVTITAGGTGYTFPPQIQFSPPAPGGIQATGIVGISGGAINSVTVTNQGAGYKSAPTISVINDQRDLTGSGAVLTVNATLVNSGGLTALYPTPLVPGGAATPSHGNPVTSLPTFTFAPASTTAATMLMNWCVTGYSGTGGTNLGTGALLTAAPSAVPATNTRASNVAGPIADIGLVQPRAAIVQPNVSGGAIAAGTLGQNAFIIDPGFGFMAVPTFAYAIGSGVAAAATTGSITATVGGVSDTTFLFPM
jgi:hypothetical protein